MHHLKKTLFIKDKEDYFIGMKTLETRLNEIMTIRKKLRDLGLGIEIVPNIQIVFDHMNTFVKEGVTWSGSVFLEEADRYIDVKLSNRRDCDVTLRVPSTSKKVSRRP